MPAVQETRVLYLGWEDPLEEEMTIHSSILAWKISWTEEPGGLQSMGREESGTTEQLMLGYLLTVSVPVIPLSWPPPRALSGSCHLPCI